MSRKLRSFAAQAVALAPSSLAFGGRELPWIGLDEGVNSEKLWDAVGRLVSSGLASGAGSVWFEIYRNLDGSINPLNNDLALDQAVRMQRRNTALRRLPCSDSTVVSSVLARLHMHKHIVLLSADLGQKEDSLRALLARNVAPVLETEPKMLGVTLILKHGSTGLTDYISKVSTLFQSFDHRGGFREIIF